MTPGAVLQNIRQTFGHGLGAAYYRDIVRQRILLTLPIRGTVDRSSEIHVLTSAQDWLNLVWTLKSFYAVSPRRYALCIHDDGTLEQTAVEQLREHFPEARLILRAEADARIERLLSAHPCCLTFRRTNPLATKALDFMAFLEGERLILFDSDLLFFRPPKAYLDVLEDLQANENVFNEDIASAYALDEAAIRDAGYEIIPRVNTGFGIIHRGSMPPDWIEEFLAIPGLADGHFWRIEQTLFALCATRHGGGVLPSEYRVHLGRGISDRPMRHYVGAVRHLMYAEGMRILAPLLLK